MTDLTSTMASNGTTDPAALAKAIAEHCAQALTGLDLVHDAFIRKTTTVDEHGYLVLDITQIGFDREDKTVRVLLQPTAPMTIATSAVAVTVPPVAAETSTDVDPVVGGSAA